MIVCKHSAIVYLIKLPKDTEKFPHLLVQDVDDSFNKGLVSNGNRGPTQNAMFIDDNLIADIWVHLKPALT